MEIKSLYYPDYLSNNMFKDKRFTISIIKSKEMSLSGSMLMKKFTEYAANNANTDDIRNIPEFDDSLKNAQNAKLKQQALSDAELVAKITLPLPNTFRESLSHSWGTDTGVMGTVGQALEQKSITDVSDGVNNAVQGAGNMFPNSKTMNTVAGASNVINNVVNKIPGAGSVNISKITGSVSNALGQNKVLTDPSFFQNYSGTRPREFTFSWDLIANNSPENKTIIEIIQYLKMFSLPNVDISGITLRAPNYFNITIGNPLISGLVNMMGVVITSINLDYGADGSMEVLPNGLPKQISLSITFAERQALTQKDFRG